MPTEPKDMFDYDRYGAFKDRTAAPTQTKLRAAARRLGLRNRYLRFLRGAARESPLLEIGCGNGSFLRDLIDAGFVNVVGIEPSSTYAPVVDPRFIIRAFAAEYLASVAPASLGTVVALDVFEHIPLDQLRVLLGLLEDRMQPGGTLLFRVPNMATGWGQFNFFGDLSHTTPLNEASISQLADGTAFSHVRFHAEPFAYPRSLAGAAGIVLWPFYLLVVRTALAAFGARPQVLTPNIVCVLTKRRDLEYPVQDLVGSPR